MVYLNGRYIALDQAKISVLDRGFLFGDGVYEVLPAYGGRLFRLDEHLTRLDNSLRNIRLASPLSREQLVDILNNLLQGNADQSIYLQITRGVAGKRDHAIPVNVSPTVFAMCSLTEKVIDPDAGICAITQQDTRWQNCHIKSTTLLANILLRQQALDRHCAETILVRNGYITEGAASNIFAVIDEIIVTPPKSNELLPGITRDLILELARENQISVREALIDVKTLASAHEIWLTSSTREILPVIELDGNDIGDRKPGQVWHKINKLFQAYKQSIRVQQ